MTAMGIEDGLVLVVSAALLGLLLLPRLQRAPSWRATVTPLASIIGSGFLVLAPLLIHRFGHQALLVMAALCALAYAVGAAIRWNIDARDLTGASDDRVGVHPLDRASSWMLVFAYVISVTYYLNLFGGFALSLTPWQSASAGRWVTTAALVLIAGIGWIQGLRGLERAEGVTVAFKLAVIGGLLAGLALFVARFDVDATAASTVPPMDWNGLRLIFGLVITVQGFETSRYLGEAYDAPTRIRTMRYAQWLSTAIYLVYIGLASLAFHADDVVLRETAVIDMMAPVASVLPLLLVLAALSAQFSAAVADTNGGGGLAEEMSQGRVPVRVAYVGLAAVALTITWSADIFQIISYASRAFSAYYALQCALASQLAWQARRPWPATGFAAMALIMALATLLGAPAE